MSRKNVLADCNSLYLQQHAENPVHWQPWSENVFEQAKEENKLVVISVGYSSCHWCHVMEHESFENEEVAEVMNENFICVKVDREERPDVDQFYMQAVQLMTKQGGWPLNCITTPEGQPVFGGTYFPKDKWIHVLETLHHLYIDEPEKVYQYASQLEGGMADYDQLESNHDAEKIDLKAALDDMVIKWSHNFDHAQGGLKQAPKFPMPNNYEFLMRYAFQTDNKKLNTFVENTLHKMANGGIYDHVGGGFTRYSTDMQWKVPHFEKMLYDNAQLLGLYSKAYQKSKDERYKLTALKIWDWLEREMQHPEGGYYSAIDADSEGIEGRFYVWTRSEINAVFNQKEKEEFGQLFDLDKTAEWEDKWIIIQRKMDVGQYAVHRNITIDEAKNIENDLLSKLFETRENREKPVTDFKRITSWNALLLEGLCDSYASFQEEELLGAALDLAKWLQENAFRKAGGLWHVNHDKGPDVEGFLEDYASVCSAYLKLYQITFDDQWIKHVRNLIQYVQMHFEDAKNPMYYFSDQQFTSVIGRKKEVSDNVIPASNSILARVFINYGRIIGDMEITNKGKNMVTHIGSRFQEYGPSFSNWGMAAMDMEFPAYELAITGKNAQANNTSFIQRYYPNVLTYGGSDQYVPQLKGKIDKQEDLYYLCEQGSCLKPTKEITDVIEELKNSFLFDH